MNPEHESQGALNASYAFNSVSKVRVIGYRYFEDPSLKANQRELFESQPGLREDMNILQDSEVKALVIQKINEIPTDIQVSI